MQAPQGGVLTLSAAKYAALRQSLAAAILKARTEAGEEASRWRSEAEAARAETEALRETLARGLALERAVPLSLPAAVEAVGAACKALGGEDGSADLDARHASFLRQARIVQTVREVCGGSAASRAPAPAVAGGPARAPARDVAGFLVELLTSMTCETPPKHALAFEDAAFRFLAASAPGDNDGLKAACSGLCQAVMSFFDGNGAPDFRGCVRGALCRLVQRGGVRGAAAALAAAAEALRGAAERCAAACAETAPASAWQEPEVQLLYDNSYYMFRVAEAAISALAAPRRGAGAAADDAAATSAMEAFARVHARAARCADALRPRFPLLALALRRVTAAANLCALHLLARSTPADC